MHELHARDVTPCVPGRAAISCAVRIAEQEPKPGILLKSFEVNQKELGQISAGYVLEFPACKSTR
jgi:hypothetical protein